VQEEVCDDSGTRSLVGGVIEILFVGLEERVGSYRGG
jgi:hypothetical protein